MFLLLQVVTVFLVSIAWAQSLAHALELPGKLRLDKDAYVATQSIYYPGFTIAGGLGDVLGTVATLGLLIATSSGGPAFVWILIALIALVFMNVVYWVVTHPVNKFWLKNQQLGNLGGRFFAVGRTSAANVADPDDAWRRFRNQWEYSHVVRAVLAGAALIALITAVAI